MDNAHSTLGLDGKVAVVTGATRGLGRAIADKLCASGCHVYLNYSRDDAGAELALKELAATRGTAVAVKGDIRKPETMELLLESVRARHSRLDIVVHNAATHHAMTATQAVVDQVHADLAGSLDPLLRSVGATAALMAGGPGRIVVVSSSGARGVVPRYVSAGITKAALENLVRYLATELAGRAIAVNAIATSKLDKGPGTPGAEMIPVLASRTPAGRLTVPADVADAVALLCTNEAAWIHGQVLTVDGGLGLWA